MRSRAVFCLLISACSTPAILTPDGTPPVCGQFPVECGNGYCCDEGQTCGGARPNEPTTCPAGSCCDDSWAFPSLSKRPPTKQRHR
jgi:hypothetical protein